jgi:hypothetical protein
LASPADGLLESGRKTAPHSINKLLIEIAMKQKTFNNEIKFPEWEILRVELNALKWIRRSGKIDETDCLMACILAHDVPRHHIGQLT